MKAETLQSRKDLNALHSKIYDEIRTDIENLHQSAHLTIRDEFFTYVRSAKEACSTENNDKDDSDWQSGEKKLRQFL